MTDGTVFLACIAYLLRFSDFAEGVFGRRFMNRGGLIMGFPFPRGIIKDEKDEQLANRDLR